MRVILGLYGDDGKENEILTTSCLRNPRVVLKGSGAKQMVHHAYWLLVGNKGMYGLGCRVLGFWVICSLIPY